LRELFTELEFTKWLHDVEQPQDSQPSQIQSDYATILTLEEWQTWLELLRAADVFALDTETTGVDALAADLVGISIAVAAGKAAYIPLNHDYIGAPEQCEQSIIVQQL